MTITITPTELAKRAEISVPFASQILSGKRKPSPEMCRRLEASTGIGRHHWRPDIFDAPDGADAADAETPVSMADGSGAGAAGCQRELAAVVPPAGGAA